MSVLNAKEQILSELDKHEFYDSSLFVEAEADDNMCKVAFSFWDKIRNGGFDVNRKYPVKNMLCKLIADFLLFEKKYDAAYKYYKLLEDDVIFNDVNSYMYGEIGRFLEINNAVFHDNDEEVVLTPYILYKKGCVYNDSYAYYYLGNYYGKKGDYEEMMNMYEKSESLGNGLAMNDLGNCYYYIKKDTEKALSYYFKAIANGQEVGYYNCGNVYMDLKDYDKAYKYYKDGHDAGCEYCMYGMISYCHMKGDFEGAINCSNNYCREEPYYCRSMKRLGDMCRDFYENYDKCMHFKGHLIDRLNCEALAYIYYEIALLYIGIDKNLVKENIFLKNIDETDIVNWMKERGNECLKSVVDTLKSGDYDELFA